jgi:hypothetical protein
MIWFKLGIAAPRKEFVMHCFADGAALKRIALKKFGCLFTRGFGGFLAHKMAEINPHAAMAYSGSVVSSFLGHANSNHQNRRRVAPVPQRWRP